MGPSTKMDSMYQDIEMAALPPGSTGEWKRKSWILDASWRLVDQLNALRKLPGPTILLNTVVTLKV